MKLANQYLPPLADGEYEMKIAQSVEVEYPDPEQPQKTLIKQDQFQEKRPFLVLSRAFTVSQSDVFSVYPQENGAGDFSNELPFLVSSVKTLPWIYENEGAPWLALIVLQEGEATGEQDMTIGQLLQREDTSAFFPDTAILDACMEADTDPCHVLDLERSLFRSIIPTKAEMKLLCHAKYTDLSDTEEEVSRLDGYFSVILGNRFLPEGKVTMHLISLRGYPDRDSPVYDSCARVRLVSLYRWTVFCQSEERSAFQDVIRQTSCSAVRGGRNHVLSRRGVCALKHYTRAGDEIGSLYHSPLIPYAPKEIPQVREPCFSSDSLLIYDPEYGLFDVSYAIAWQLGQLQSLADSDLTGQLTQLRRTMKKTREVGMLRESTREILPDFADVCRQWVRLYDRRAEREAEEARKTGGNALEKITDQEKTGR